MPSTDTELIYLTVDMWHPDCWTLHVTQKVDAGLLGYEMTIREADIADRFRLYRVYGDSRDAVAELIDAVDDTDLTEAVIILSPTAAPDSRTFGSITQDILVEFDPAPGTRAAFTSRGFMHYGPSQHENGRERRTLLTISDRDRVYQALEDIEDAYDADITIERFTTSHTPSGMQDLPSDGLSPRQREAFQLARTRGYYDYPRNVTAQDLADEFGISRTTFLEHLRKAERELLTGIEFH
ncbi:helix-turn-helix domain-containing protein [Haladaptatus pallidirubidus]|uniref:Helix-turn-helix domain-containing protein n=1 Tax=Haladaptatus pallidirubidus TaxID=1008152 RepID=A0AAV3UQC4_9EURY|nr:helix-turn-helix domain-containing protein [Haladaptatus pallidirubidus]